LSAANNNRGFGGGGGVININVSGARGNQEIQQMVNAGVSQGIAGYDRGLLGRVQTQMVRFG
jgi:hypothetical protein